MTDFGSDDVEEDEEKKSNVKSKKWKVSGGYLPTPQRGAPWKCDCIFGNPEPNRIILVPEFHNTGCPIRRRMFSSGYTENRDIHGNLVTWK